MTVFEFIKTPSFLRRGCFHACYRADNKTNLKLAISAYSVLNPALVLNREAFQASPSMHAFNCYLLDSQMNAATVQSAFVSTEEGC